MSGTMPAFRRTGGRFAVLRTTKVKELEDGVGSRAQPASSVRKRGQRLVPVSLWLGSNLALYVAMRERRMSNSELARKMGYSETVVRRILDPEHHTKPEELQAALALLGMRLAISVENAA